ncbi:MAG: hypothetical protein RIE73_33495 [Coleofasciculus sp. C1-SOL-03]
MRAGVARQERAHVGKGRTSGKGARQERAHVGKGRTSGKGARRERAHVGAPLRFGLGEFCLDAQFHTSWLATLPR